MASILLEYRHYFMFTIQDMPAFRQQTLVTIATNPNLGINSITRSNVIESIVIRIALANFHTHTRNGHSMVVTVMLLMHFIYELIDKIIIKPIR